VSCAWVPFSEVIVNRGSRPWHLDRFLGRRKTPVGYALVKKLWRSCVAALPTCAFEEPVTRVRLIRPASCSRSASIQFGPQEQLISLSGNGMTN
jgi:hypothetical protein